MGHRFCLENFENRNFNSYLQQKHDFSVASATVTAPFELYRVMHMTSFLDCHEYAAWKKFAIFNRISWIASTVCALYQMLRPFNHFRYSCTDRETQCEGLYKRRLQGGKGEIFRPRGWMMSNWVMTN